MIYTRTQNWLSSMVIRNLEARRSNWLSCHLVHLFVNSLLSSFTASSLLFTLLIALITGAISGGRTLNASLLHWLWLSHYTCTIFMSDNNICVLLCSLVVDTARETVGEGPSTVHGTQSAQVRPTSGRQVGQRGYYSRGQSRIGPGPFGFHCGAGKREKG